MPLPQLKPLSPRPLPAYGLMVQLRATHDDIMGVSPLTDELIRVLLAKIMTRCATCHMVKWEKTKRVRRPPTMHDILPS